MFDHLLESSHRDDSNKWSNIGFGEEITQVESIKVKFTHFIWSSVKPVLLGVDSVALFITVNKQSRLSLNQTLTAVFTLLLHLLIPGDHITRIYLL